LRYWRANIGRIPSSHRYVVVEVLDGISVESHNTDTLPTDWDAENNASARAFGDQWLKEARTAILVVPSVIARLDLNALVNPLHLDASKLISSSPEKVIWDKRLFERLSG
jgi:RES domain-containing protein